MQALKDSKFITMSLRVNDRVYPYLCILLNKLPGEQKQTNTEKNKRTKTGRYFAYLEIEREDRGP